MVNRCPARGDEYMAGPRDVNLTAAYIKISTGDSIIIRRAEEKISKLLFQTGRLWGLTN